MAEWAKNYTIGYDPYKDNKINSKLWIKSKKDKTMDDNVNTFINVIMMIILFILYVGGAAGILIFTLDCLNII